MVHKEAADLYMRVYSKTLEELAGLNLECVVVDNATRAAKEAVRAVYGDKELLEGAGCE